MFRNGMYLPDWWDEIKSYCYWIDNVHDMGASYYHCRFLDKSPQQMPCPCTNCKSYMTHKETDKILKEVLNNGKK